MSCKNITALKDLINLYKSITLKDLDVCPFNSQMLMGNLTGFGTIKCMLCQSLYDIVNREINTCNFHFGNCMCRNCVHSLNPGSDTTDFLYCQNTPGMNEIMKAESPIQLYQAIKKRIDYLENKLLPMAQESESELRNLKSQGERSK